MAFWPDAKDLAVGCQGITSRCVSKCLLRLSDKFLCDCCGVQAGWFLNRLSKHFMWFLGGYCGYPGSGFSHELMGHAKPLLVRLKLNLISFLDDFWCCIHFPFDQKVWQKPCYNLTFSRMWDSPTVWCPARVGTDPRWTGDLTNANLWLMFTENSSFKGNYSLINTFL